MAPINKKFRAVDALKHSMSSSNSSYSPPSSPSVSSPPSVIVRNDSQRIDTAGSCSSDSEQIDPQISRRASHNDPMANQQDLPIDATIGAKIDEHFETNLDSRAPSTGDSTSNESIEMLNNSEERAASFANSSLLGFNGKNQISSLFKPISPPSPLSSYEKSVSRSRRNHSQHRHKHSDNHHHELLQHSDSSYSSKLNPEVPLHHHIRNHLHLHPKHLNLPHLKDHQQHHHQQSHSNSHSLHSIPNLQCTDPSPSSYPFEHSPQPHVHPFTFPFSPNSSAHSLPPSPPSVITENSGNHQKDSSSSGPGYCDSNKIRTRADNSNSEPFPYESRLRNFSPISKHSTKSPPTLIPSEPHSHRHVSFRVDNNVSPTPSKSSTTSESHKSSSSSSGSKGSVDKNSEEYRLRRERNNIAVRKSRSKSKVKFIQTIDRMNQLEEENNKLHAKIEEMTRLVSYLQVMLSKYRLEDPRRFEHLEHLMAIEMSQYPVLI